MTTEITQATETGHAPAVRKELARVTIRFAGDSGDGMQLVGSQFTSTSAVLGNDVSTFPNYPAEIRAPAGSVAGVSSFQVSFASQHIFTPGDMPDVLVAMNPAALRSNLSEVPRGAVIVVDSDEFSPANLKKAGYEHNPLEDGSLESYHVIPVPMTSMNHRALAHTGLGAKEIARCKNFFALGLMCWLYDRPLDLTLRLVGQKFDVRPELAEANKTTLQAGYAFGETTEVFAERYTVPRAPLEPGVYRSITGNAATAWGCLAAAELCGRPLFCGSYPITPATEVLHELARLKQFGVRTFQAEDEISAIGSAVGAAFGGALAMTATSGPGVALKSEALGMAVMTELPLVLIDVQRAGPSTGMPTKTEQSDLLQVMFGRNGESPLAVLAAATPADCFTMAIEAFRLATRFMTPVVLLSDGYLAAGSEPWKIPDVKSLPRFEVHLAEPGAAGSVFLPYGRDERTLARPWAVPGTPGLEHRIGSLEKEDRTGFVSYDPANHERMVQLRAAKIARIAADVPEQDVYGPPQGRLAVVSWGSTYGAVHSAVERHQAEGRAVAHLHLRYLNPFPRNLGTLLAGFERILVPELNLGQLQLLLRARFLVDAVGYQRVTGHPFAIAEVYDEIGRLWGGQAGGPSEEGTRSAGGAHHG